MAADRPYIAGDPVGLIDWKAFAKNEQLIVRQDEDHTPGTIRIIIDTSQSMAWPDQGVIDATRSVKELASAITKGELAWRITIAIVESYLADGNTIELYTANMQDFLTVNAANNSAIGPPNSTYSERHQLFDGIAGNGRRLRHKADLAQLADELLNDPGFTSGTYTLEKVSFHPSKSQMTYYVGDAIFLGRFRHLMPSADFGAADPTHSVSKRDNLAAAAGSFLASIDTLVHVLSSLERNPRWMNSKWGYSARPQKGNLPINSRRFSRPRSAFDSFRGRFLKGRGDLQSQVSAWCAELEKVVGRTGGHYLDVTEETVTQQFFADLLGDTYLQYHLN